MTVRNNLVLKKTVVMPVGTPIEGKILDAGRIRTFVFEGYQVLILR